MRSFMQTIGLSLLLLVTASWQVQAQAQDKSLFWKLESPAGITSYLFGTIHTDDNRVTNFSPAVLNALGDIDTFMMEVTEARDPSLFMMKEGNLAQYLTSDEFDKVRDLTDFHTMHLGAAMQMKPWLLAVVFDLPRPQTPFAQDNLLMTTAEDKGKRVEGIESPQAHFGVMDNFTIDEQMSMLRAVLKRSQKDKEKDFERLMSAYLSGDADKVIAMDEKITGSLVSDNIWQRMRKVLLDDRNGAMATRTIAKATEVPVFIAVGAAHLGGDTGLIKAFRDAGFKLTALKK